VARFRLAVASLLLVALPAAVRAEDAPAGQQPVTWHAQAFAHSESGLNVTHFWSKGAKLRAETVIAGRRVVTIVNGGTYYAYDALGMEGVAIQRSQEAIAADRPDRRPFGRELEILLGQGAEKVRDDVLQGAPCEVYRVTDGAGKRELWITKSDPALPVRLEIYSRAAGKTRYTDYLNWSRGLKISDRFFEPEPGVTFQRYNFEDYVRITVNEGPIGPVPVLYADLVHGGR
jgi:hypothetical protein